MTSGRRSTVAVLFVVCAARCVTISTSDMSGQPNGVTAEQVIPGATQQLLDALPHDAPVWQRYLSERAVYVSEGGDVATKQDLLEGFVPFPEGITGSIKIQTVKLVTHGDTAIHVFDAHETQTIYGQSIEVKYRSTHTWYREGGQWRLIAAQNLVVPQDPSPVPLAARLADYVGTYELGGKRRYRVEQSGTALVGGREGTELRSLIAVGENVFFDAGSNLGILRIFIRGRDGSVDRMLQRRKFADTIWAKVSSQ